MRRIGYVLGAAWQGFWRNPVMSIAATLTVALMLVLFAFFIITDRGLQAAASALGRSADIGRIAPGYRADLAVLDGSLMDASESSLPELRARLVAVGGEITHIA